MLSDSNLRKRILSYCAINAISKAMVNSSLNLQDIQKAQILNLFLRVLSFVLVFVALYSQLRMTHLKLFTAWIFVRASHCHNCTIFSLLCCNCVLRSCWLNMKNKEKENYHQVTTVHYRPSLKKIVLIFLCVFFVDLSG